MYRAFVEKKTINFMAYKSVFINRRNDNCNIKVKRNEEGKFENNDLIRARAVLCETSLFTFNISFFFSYYDTQLKLQLISYSVTPSVLIDHTQSLSII